jgi:DNA invertase Pin-like site-specific DNA recombinase
LQVTVFVSYNVIMENQKNAVIYARYSSAGQTEQSIEGQIRVNTEFARANRYNIIGEYIDRAKTGTNDNRPQFQEMIADASKKRISIYYCIQSGQIRKKSI